MIRAPLTPDTARKFAARDFDDAMDAAGVSNEQLKNFLLVDEKLIRELRNGKKPLTLGRINQLPERLGQEVLRRAAARIAGGALPGDPTAEGQTLVADGAIGEWFVAKARSMADRVWTAEEARRDLSVLRRTIAVLRRTIAALRALEQRLERVADGEEKLS